MYLYTITCCEPVDVHDDRETACKCGSTFLATGPNPPAPICRTCGFTHPETDCPRWSAPLFDQLTIDELKSLMAALRTRNGYSSNKMAYMLGMAGIGPLAHTYGEIAEEQGELICEVGNLIIEHWRAA